MSTWISKAAQVIVLLGLAACQTVPGAPGANLGTASGPVRVLAGDVKVEGPRGYCADPASLQQRDDSAVLLLGRCSSETAVPPAVLTVAVGRSGSASVFAAGGGELAGFFKTDTGRATLSRRGAARDVSIVTALMSKGAFLLRIRDRAQGEYWRAMVPVGGRMISVSAAGPDLPLAEGRRLVEATVTVLRRINSAQ